MPYKNRSSNEFPRCQVMDMGNPFFTIGHSTRSIAEFTDLLAQAGVETVVDVRTVPRSRTNPHYNRDTLAADAVAVPGRLRASFRARRLARKEPGDRSAASTRSGACRAFTISPTMPWARRSVPVLRNCCARRRAAVRHHVRRGDVVALSPADHHRLPDCRRGERVPCARTQPYRAGADDRSGEFAARRNADLSCAA